MRLYCDAEMEQSTKLRSRWTIVISGWCTKLGDMKNFMPKPKQYLAKHLLFVALYRILNIRESSFTWFELRLAMKSYDVSRFFLQIAIAEKEKTDEMIGFLLLVLSNIAVQRISHSILIFWCQQALLESIAKRFMLRFGKLKKLRGIPSPSLNQNYCCTESEKLIPSIFCWNHYLTWKCSARSMPQHYIVRCLRPLPRMLTCRLFHDELFILPESPRDDGTSLNIIKTTNLFQ